ncbi:MAG: ethanolamine utilization protein EutN [Symbiobacteriaceae bacterium]|nr:ethanolamine utilization protein EutN [Symbiobacteriaceae bacterium]
MLLCKVRSKCTATIKDARLTGLSLVVVEQVATQEIWVAADPLGVPPGALVLVVTGAAARLAVSKPDAPLDHCIVAILDNEEFN